MPPLFPIPIYIFPNPTSYQIFIEKKDVRIEINQVLIRNANGIKVKEIGSFDFAERKREIDISDLSSGIYVLEINTDIGKVFKKMIVIR
ncbi:MAG: T9SS type A sorting domain-containing protein [Saprospiraceae bacterium]